MWDQVRAQTAARKLAKERQAAVAAYVQSNTPEGASGCRQAVVSHEGRGSCCARQPAAAFAGMSSARAAVSTTAAAPTENPGNDHQAPLTGLVAGARLQQAKQILGQRSLL